MCNATGDAPIDIRWSKKGSNVLPNSVHASGGDLHFRQISSSDQGQYVCQVCKLLNDH